MAHLSEKAKELRNKYKAKYGYFPSQEVGLMAKKLLWKNMKNIWKKNYQKM